LFLEEIQQQGIKEVGAFVAQFDVQERLTHKQLKAYSSAFIDGWSIPGLCDEGITLRILISQGFPLVKPRLAIHPSRPVLSLPNLEENGLLCLSPDNNPASPSAIQGDALNLLQDGQALVNNLIRGEGRERFEDEFISYWVRWRKISGRFVSLCDPFGPTRWVYSYDYGRFKLVAETKAAIKSWGLNYIGKNLKSTGIEKIPLAVLERPWHPDQYPTTVRSLLATVAEDEEANRIVREYLFTPPFEGRKKVLVGFPGKNGFGFAGLMLPPVGERSSQKRYHHNPMERLGFGFRNKLPEHVFLSRMCSMPFRGALVQRCDGPWIHGRGYNPQTETLMQKTAVCIGIGSLGSGVGELLAKMGVGRIIFIDPDVLEPENASRHTLGVCIEEAKKSDKLAESLRTRFPHLQFDSHPTRWEYLNQRCPDVLTTADLVISTTGDWGAEGPLNLVSKDTKGFPPIIFGWVEDHAAAGHAAVFFKGKGCLRCLVDQRGRPTFPVTLWPEEGTSLHVPLCGGMFQPYGAIELSHTHGLVADLAIDVLLGAVSKSEYRTWIGQKKNLAVGRGNWNPRWREKYGDPEDGGKLLVAPFAPDNTCPVCKDLK
jgi:molybdopterin/thiamine biosynthesis adenylyltransferase